MIIKRATIFLDRDGVLCKEKSYIKNKDELEIFEFAEKAITQLKCLGYLTIIITNQSGVAKGIITPANLNEIHRHLKETTGVDGIYYCPHFPPTKDQKVEPPYRVHCNCRKPQIGLIEQAEKDYPIDFNKSFFVGDRASDIKTGKAIGVTTVLLESGYGTLKLEEEVVPDLTFNNLHEFVLYIEKCDRK